MNPTIGAVITIDRNAKHVNDLIKDVKSSMPPAIEYTPEIAFLNHDILKDIDSQYAKCEELVEHVRNGLTLKVVGPIDVSLAEASLAKLKEAVDAFHEIVAEYDTYSNESSSTASSNLVTLCVLGVTIIWVVAIGLLIYLDLW